MTKATKAVNVATFEMTPAVETVLIPLTVGEVIQPSDRIVLGIVYVS